MIYLRLFYKFIIVGLFSFGGAYSSIPLVRDVAKSFVNYDDEMFENFIAISECTPGPITINMATFVGTDVAGFLGAVISTFAVSLPAFIIIIVIFSIFKNAFNNPKIKYVLLFVRPAVVGILLAMAINMVCNEVKINSVLHLSIKDYDLIKVLSIFIFILLFMKIYNIITSKKLSVLCLICLGGLFGIVINILL